MTVKKLNFVWYSFILMLLFTSSVRANETTSNINYDGMPVHSAISPNVSAFGSDMCRSGVSGAANTGVVSISGGVTIVDETCELIRISKALDSFGLKVAAVSVMCQDERVFKAMLNAGSPCPIKGAVSKKAYEEWYKLKPEIFKEMYGEDFHIGPRKEEEDHEEVAKHSAPESFPYRK